MRRRTEDWQGQIRGELEKIDKEEKARQKRRYWRRHNARTESNSFLSVAASETESMSISASIHKRSVPSCSFVLFRLY